MNYSELADRIDGAFESWELFFLKEKSKKYECREKEIYSIDLMEEEGIALRGIKDGKMVCTYTFEKNGDAAGMLLENSKILLPFVERDDDARFP